MATERKLKGGTTFRGISMVADYQNDEHPNHPLLQTLPPSFDSDASALAITNAVKFPDYYRNFSNHRRRQLVELLRTFVAPTPNGIRTAMNVDWVCK